MNNTTIGNITSKIVDKTWNVIKNGIQSLLSLFQKRQLPAIEPAELPPDEPIIPAPFVLEEYFVLEESESDEPDERLVLEESESDLRGFDRQYTIRGGRGWYDRNHVASRAKRRPRETTAVNAEAVLNMKWGGVRELITNRLAITIGN